MEKEYYDAQVRYLNEIRSIRHDMHAHMIVLQYYLESEEYEKAKEYVDDLKKEKDISRLFLEDTGYDLVNAIINDALNHCTRKVQIELEGFFSKEFIMKPYDVCTLFSNIFSNACEACEKLKNTEPVIRVQIWESEEECFFAVQNPIEWKVATGKEGFLTTKLEKKTHGYGTKNMMKVVKKNKGKIDFIISDTSFRVELSFQK